MIKENYNKEMVFKYYKHILEKTNSPLAYKELPPHVFAISAEAYR